MDADDRIVGDEAEVQGRVTRVLKGQRQHLTASPTVHTHSSVMRATITACLCAGEVEGGQGGVSACRSQQLLQREARAAYPVVRPQHACVAPVEVVHAKHHLQPAIGSVGRPSSSPITTTGPGVGVAAAAESRGVDVECDACLEGWAVLVLDVLCLANQPHLSSFALTFSFCLCVTLPSLLMCARRRGRGGGRGARTVVHQECGDEGLRLAQQGDADDA